MYYSQLKLKIYKNRLNNYTFQPNGQVTVYRPFGINSVALSIKHTAKVLKNIQTTKSFKLKITRYYQIGWNVN